MEILWFAKCWNCHKHVLSWIEIGKKQSSVTYVHHAVGTDCLLGENRKSVS
jgi:hypothetical protein